MLTDEQLRTALRRAFALGQTYFQQADSESRAENLRSDQTRAKFDLLVMETSVLLCDGTPGALVGLSPLHAFGADEIMRTAADQAGLTDAQRERFGVPPAPGVPASDPPASDPPADLPPVHIDVERLRRALSGPRIMIPQGLSAQEVIDFINAHADGVTAAPAPQPLGYVDPQRLRNLQTGKELNITLVAKSEADLRDGGDVPLYAGGVQGEVPRG